MGLTSPSLTMPSLRTPMNYVTLIAIVALWQGVTCRRETPPEFDRAVTGVTFKPYVHQNIKKEMKEQDWTSYSLKDVETMMKVISKRFSKIVTFTVGANAGTYPYKENYTYYKSFSQVLAAEAAANVNKEKRKEKSWTPIEMYAGVWVYNNADQFQMEISLANESVSKANAIYSKTVAGLVFSHNEIASDETRAANTLEGIKQFSDVSKRTGLKLGSRQDCECLDSSEPTRLMQTRKEIVAKSNFLICVLPAYSADKGTFKDFLNSKYTSYKNQAKSWNPDIEIMVRTDISGNLDNAVELKRLRHHWETANQWAAKEGVTMWMQEAFDNPWKNGTEAHFGWWKLLDNKKTGSVDGYLEKVSQGGSNGPSKDRHGSGSASERGRDRLFIVVPIVLAIIMVSAIP